MKHAKPIVASNDLWLKEIVDAYLNAKAALPYAVAAGKDMKEDDLFHMAPLVCLSFRGIEHSDENRRKATDAAISSYIANEEANQGVLSNPVMAFSFCYILAHYGLDLISDGQCQDILFHVESNLSFIEAGVEG